MFRILCFVMLACCACLAVDAEGTPYVYKKVGDRELQLYAVSPDEMVARGGWPAIVFFNGGGWVNGGPTQFNEQAKYFAKRGMVAIQVEYRLLDKGTEEPPLICIQDAKSAMRWVRSHARELHINPERIASAGGSAGGHLAAFVGMVGGLDDPKDNLSVSAKSNAMVLFNPVFDNGPGGWGHDRVGDRYKEFSPFHNITKDAPPAIIFLGTKDALVPVDTVKAFAAAMKQAGVRADAHFYEGQVHGFFNFGKEGGKYKETVRAADEFLTSLGWLKGSPLL